ncbi:hypothetical protein [Streptomyces sp. NPDC093970]|uniref:hypothetical protein n=1 Tax=Streptomyces sp. NPDC093970 TaxID=3155076 RepID=UPI00341D2E8A
MKRIAGVMAAAGIIVGMGAIAAPSASAGGVSQWTNVFIKSYSSSSACYAARDQKNGSYYPDDIDQYYYCGSAGNKNLWFREAVPGGR